MMMYLILNSLDLDFGLKLYILDAINCSVSSIYIYIYKAETFETPTILHIIILIKKKI